VGSGLQLDDNTDGSQMRVQKDARANAVASHRESPLHIAAAEKEEVSVAAALVREVGLQLCSG